MKKVLEIKSRLEKISDTKENYLLSLKSINNEYIVFAIQNEKIIGKLMFIKSRFKPNLIGTSIVVDPNYRRQGIASSMYVYAEKQLKMKFIRNDDVLTPDGKVFWNNFNSN